MSSRRLARDILTLPSGRARMNKPLLSLRNFSSVALRGRSLQTVNDRLWALSKWQRVSLPLHHRAKRRVASLTCRSKVHLPSKITVDKQAPRLPRPYLRTTAHKMARDPRLSGMTSRTSGKCLKGLTFTISSSTVKTTTVNHELTVENCRMETACHQALEWLQERPNLILRRFQFSLSMLRTKGMCSLPKGSTVCRDLLMHRSKGA